MAKKLVGKEAIGELSGASELCFDEKIRAFGNWDLPKRVVIDDLTLREGRQTEACILTVDEAVHIAELLEYLGVPMIQIGNFALTDSKGSSFDVPYMKAIGKAFHGDIEAMAASHQVPPFTKQAAMESLQRSLDCGVGYVLCSALSDDILTGIQDASGGAIKGNLEALRDREIDINVELVQYAKSQGRPMNVNLQDYLRCDFDFMERFVRALVENGVNIIILDDIIAPGPPLIYQYVTNWVHKRVPEARLGIHVHNDYGNAMNAVLGAVQGGAEVLTCGMNALGERAGHTDLGALVINLEYFYGFDTGIHTERLCEVSQAIADITKQPVPPAWPLTGAKAYSHVMDWHWQYQSHPYITTCVQPEAVGATPRAIFGEYPGHFGIRIRAEAVGITEEISDSKMEEVINGLRAEMMWRKRPITDNEFCQIVLPIIHKK
ncbi:hypothetical protein ACFLW6_03760 [Chloroflexota bacterium]